MPPPHPQVLTIGATNLAQELDAALLRPGRFEVVYEVRCSTASHVVRHSA